MMTQALITVGIIVGAAVASFVIGFLWKHVFRRIAHRTPTKLDVMVLERTQRPVIFGLLVAGMYYAFWRLGTQSEFEGYGIVAGANKIFFILAVIAVVALIQSVIRALTDWYLQEVAVRTSTRVDEQVATTLNKLLRIVLFAIAAMMIIRHFGVDISALLATAGIASLAVAFAAQDSLGNLFAGLTIMLDRPFRKGDRVELADGRLGDVHEIGLRSTKILTFDHTLIVVPNAEVAKGCIINYSYPNLRYKVRQVIGVAYGSDVANVKKVLVEICTAHPKVLTDPEPMVHFVEFADSSLNFRLMFWIEDYHDRWAVTDEINTQIDKQFREEKIEIPFPQRDVHLYKEA